MQRRVLPPQKFQEPLYGTTVSLIILFTKSNLINLTKQTKVMFLFYFCSKVNATYPCYYDSSNIKDVVNMLKVRLDFILSFKKICINDAECWQSYFSRIPVPLESFAEISYWRFHFFIPSYLNPSSVGSFLFTCRIQNALN